MTVDDTRIFYDTVAAAQELYRLTGNLECKIDQVEKISAKLARFAKNKKMGSMASGLSGFTNFGNGDDGKSLSFSRASLTSTTTTNTEKNKKRKNAKSYLDGSLCSSKFTQGTIVTLVIIMAFCLLAMCTLYVLDWYNRTYVYNAHIPIMTHPNNTQDYIGNMIEMKDKLPLSWIPPTQPFAPILASMCGLRSQCPQYCCIGTPKFASGEELMNEKASIIKKNSTSSTNNQLNSDVTIHITNLNVTLDQRYCVENSCKPRIGRYNLYVPVSPFLPTIPLHLKFL